VFLDGFGMGEHLLVGEAQFRRVKGFRELPALAVALRRAVGLPEGEEAAPERIIQPRRPSPKFHDERDILASVEPAT
jgi:hypothetical protein